MTNTGLNLAPFRPDPVRLASHGGEQPRHFPFDFLNIAFLLASNIVAGAALLFWFYWRSRRAKA